MRVRSMEDHIHVLTAAKFSGFPSASNGDINLAVIRRMFAPSLGIRWHVEYEEPNLPVASKVFVSPVRDGLKLRSSTGVPALQHPKTLCSVQTIVIEISESV